MGNGRNGSNSGQVVELLRHSTDDLDLTKLPARLDDATLAMVQDIARSPLPPPVPCGEKHFSKCLRIMLAVLPRQAADEISGELFVAAYQRKLGHYPEAAINFLADRAMEQCRWFPTIAECLEILTGWTRYDEHTRRRADAIRIAGAERRQREDEQREWRWASMKALSQSDVDGMTDQVRRIGLACGALVEVGGVVTPAPEVGPFADDD